MHTDILNCPSITKAVKKAVNLSFGIDLCLVHLSFGIDLCLVHLSFGIDLCL